MTLAAIRGIKGYKFLSFNVHKNNISSLGEKVKEKEEYTAASPIEEKNNYDPDPKGTTTLPTVPISLPEIRPGETQYQILAICGTNVFRSPLLEYRLSRLFQEMEAGGFFKVTSRAVSSGWMSEKSLYESKTSIADDLKKAKLLNQDLENFIFTHRPQQLAEEDVRKANLILD